MVKLTDKKIKWAVEHVSQKYLCKRWFQEYRRPRWWFDTAYAFAEWYNNRVQEALDLEYFETQNEAFIREMSGENTLGMFIEWSERVVSL